MEKREETQINKIISEKGDITPDTIEIQRIIRDYQNTNKLDNSEEMENSFKKIQPTKTESGRNR